MNPHAVIIVAGGKGVRMGLDLPKQFIALAGKPILMHTIQAFYNFDASISIVLVLPAAHQTYWAALCVEYNFTIPHTIATGGENRFESVRNGLQLVQSQLVAIHDGVRPFASIALITRCFEAARTAKAVIPVIDATDSLRLQLAEGHSKAMDRALIKLVQTPQIFDTESIKEAYKANYSPSFTDDASVVEAMGVHVQLVQGESTNIKITTALDLKLGEWIFENNKR